ncbi:hypothetical protein [Streptomyces sp. NPDC091649]|uniref:hypothetical protein n=1 Tax=Streptomyces sp. NPDC091649 TaxID=3366004 RepID=UPI0037F9C416
MLAVGAEAGRRSAVWARSLPGSGPGPVAAWLAEDLPLAIEAAMGGPEPEECDHMGLDGAVVDGTGGVDAATMETMTTVPCVIPESVCLTPDQQVRLLAVAFAVTGAVRLLTNDPGTAILHGLLTRTCAVLTTPPVRTVSLCHRTLSVCHRRLSSLLRDYPVRHVAHTVTPCRAATAPQCGWSSGCTRRSTSGHE